MTTLSLSHLTNDLEYLFDFLNNYGYVLSQQKIINDDESKITYINKEIGKEIFISICNSSNTERFFIIIAIIRMPHIVVHDYISFDVYLTKNNIKHPEALEGNERNFESANEYVKTYTELFKKYGTDLITTDKQFPHYFPEWT